MKEFYGKYKQEVLILGGLLILAVFLFVGYKIYNFFADKTEPGSDETVVVNQNNLTYALGDYGILADSLDAAMNTAGNNFDTVLATLQQCQTADDLRQLIKTFGKRPNYFFGITKYTETLPHWLKEEFDGSELSEITTLFNSFNVPL